MKELSRIVIHVGKIVTCASQLCHQCPSQLFRRNFGHSCDQVTLRISLSEKMTMAVAKDATIQVSFLKVGSKQKTKIKHMEYHIIFIAFKGHFYSKHGSPVFLLLKSWSLILYVHVSFKAKFFLITLTGKI